MVKQKEFYLVKLFLKYLLPCFWDLALLKPDAFSCSYGLVLET